MSPVIKSADAVAAHRVRPLRLDVRPGEESGVIFDAERVRLRAELDQAASLIAEREAEIQRLHAEVERAAREAESKGHQAGLEAAEDRQAERLATLKAGVAAAALQFSAELASLERLAPALAAEGLERLIGDPGHRSDLLREAVLVNVQRLDADSIVRVEVANADFPVLAELTDALSTAAHRKVDVRYARDLVTGQCRIRLVLGELEVGLDQQWDRLSMLLRDLATQEPAV